MNANTESKHQELETQLLSIIEQSKRLLENAEQHQWDRFKSNLARRQETIELVAPKLNLMLNHNYQPFIQEIRDLNAKLILLAGDVKKEVGSTLQDIQKGARAKQFYHQAL